MRFPITEINDDHVHDKICQPFCVFFAFFQSQKRMTVELFFTRNYSHGFKAQVSKLKIVYRSSQVQVNDTKWTVLIIGRASRIPLFMKTLPSLFLGTQTGESSVIKLFRATAHPSSLDIRDLFSWSHCLCLSSHKRSLTTRRKDTTKRTLSIVLWNISLPTLPSRCH